jgi:hypothetical protein
MLEIIFGAWLVEERLDVGEHRPQREGDIVGGDRVFVDRFAGDIVEGPLALDQENHRLVQSAATPGVGRVATQGRRGLADQADGRRAAQHPRGDRATEF